MGLSNRGINFLKNQKFRKDAIKSLRTINNAFKKIKLEPSKEIIDFQIKYGGLILYAGLEPVCFGIIHGILSRGEFASYKRIFNRLIFTPKEPDFPIDLFLCADTLYQMDFSIDINGQYYEDCELAARNFDFVIEDWAIHDEITKNGYKYRLKRNNLDKEHDIGYLKDYLKIKDYPEFEVDKVFWGKSNEFAIRICKDSIVLYSKNEIKNQTISILKRLTEK